MQESFLTFLGENLQLFLTYTGVYNATPGHLIMILVGLLFIFLAIKYEFEPMLLIPIGFGILIGNIPFKDAGLQVGIYEQGSVLNILYQGVTSGHDRLLRIDLQSKVDVDRCSGSVRYLWCLYDCSSNGI